MEGKVATCIQSGGVNASCGGGGKKMQKPVRLMGHCIFCLRKVSKEQKERLQNDTGENRVVPGVGNLEEQLVPVLNLVWPWIQKRKEVGGGKGNEPLLEEVISGKASESSVQSAASLATAQMRFPKLPALCCYCGDKLNEVEVAMKEVRSKVEALKKTITESQAGGKLGWREQQFKRSLEEARVAKEEIESTLEFLHCLGGFTEKVSKLDNKEAEDKDKPAPLVESTNQPEVSSSERMGVTPIPREIKRYYGRSKKVDEGKDAANPGPSSVVAAVKPPVPSGTPAVAVTKPNQVTLTISKKVVSIPNSEDDLTEDSTDSYSELPEEQRQRPAGLSEDNDSDSDPDWIRSECEEETVMSWEEDSNTDNDTKDPLTEPENEDPPSKKTKTSTSALPENKELSLKSDATKVIPEPRPAKRKIRRRKYICPVPGCFTRFSIKYTRNVHVQTKHADYPGTLSTDDEFGLEEQSYDEVELPPRVEVKSKVPIEEILDSAWSSKLNKYVCSEEQCTYSSEGRTFFSLHLSNKHPKTYAPFPCTCGSYFLTEAVRLRHFTSSVKHRVVSNRPTPATSQVYSRKYQQTCDLCGQRIPYITIMEHLQTHVGDYAVKCPNPECDYSFSNSTAMFKHLGGGSGKPCRAVWAKATGRKVECETCGFKAKNKLIFKSHLKQQHERGTEKSFQCPITGCDKRYAVRQSVDFHIRTHTELMAITTQKCEECVETVKTENIEEHLREVHKCQEILKCQQCSCKFMSRSGLVEHLYVHRHSGMYCDLCNNGSKYFRHAELRNHYIQAHALQVKMFKCEECTKEFYSRASLQTHNQIKHTSAWKHPPKKRTRTCDLCFEPSKTYTSDEGLLNHKITVHKLEPFSCDTCGQKFTSLNKLGKHEKEHAGIVTKKEWKCEVEGCGKVFVGDKKNFTRHTKLYHSNEPPGFVCDLCGKAFFYNRKLNEHYQAVHLGVRPWVCETCGEAFTHSKTLKIHTLIHSEERPHMCSICGQRFRQKEVMNTHIRSHQEKGAAFKPNGPMKKIRKRVVHKNKRL